LAEALRKEGFSVRVHDDHLKPDEADDVWLASCGRSSWIAITPDRRILKDPQSMKANATRIFTRWGSLSAHVRGYVSLLVKGKRTLGIIINWSPRVTREDFRPENDPPGGSASESGFETPAHLQAIRRISL